MVQCRFPLANRHGALRRDVSHRERDDLELHIEFRVRLGVGRVNRLEVGGNLFHMLMKDIDSFDG